MIHTLTDISYLEETHDDNEIFDNQIVSTLTVSFQISAVLDPMKHHLDQDIY